MKIWQEKAGFCAGGGFYGLRLVFTPQQQMKHPTPC